MKKIFIVLFVFLLLFVPVQKTNAQVLDISMLPKMADIHESGVVVETNSIKYLYNNGYLNVWFEGANEIYQFIWSDNYWKMSKIIPNVLSDYCVAVEHKIVSFSEDKETKINNDNTYLKSSQITRTAQVKDFTYSRTLSFVFISILSVALSIHYMPIVARDITMYVRNKKPDEIGFIVKLVSNGLQDMNCEPIFSYYKEW